MDGAGRGACTGGPGQPSPEWGNDRYVSHHSISAYHVAGTTLGTGGRCKLKKTNPAMSLWLGDGVGLYGKDVTACGCGRTAKMGQNGSHAHVLGSKEDHCPSVRRSGFCQEEELC